MKGQKNITIQVPTLCSIEGLSITPGTIPYRARREEEDGQATTPRSKAYENKFIAL